MRINNLALATPIFKKYYFDILFLVVALLFSYLLMQLRFSLNGEFGPGSLAALTNYSASKPFQYRVLMPWLANLLLKLGFPPFNSILGTFKVLETISVFSIILSFRYYISLFVNNKTIVSFLAFSILYILPFNFLLPRIIPVYYPYDMPSIFFFTLGLIFMYRQKWIAYYAVFVFATFNRETTSFLTFIYLFTSIRRERPNRVFLHCCAQFIIWVIIKAVLFKLFYCNPGQNGFEWFHMNSDITHLSTNISFLLYFRNYPFFFSNLGFIWIPVFFYYRLIKIEFVQRSLLVIFPFFIGMMFVGNIFEIRIFGELIPVFLMAFLLILKEIFREKSAITE